MATHRGGVRVTGFRLGFQTHLHGVAPARELYPAVVDLFQAAEDLGFDSGWVAQHHLSTAEGRLPSPLVFLAAVAERTRSIRLGTSILTIGLGDPVRDAEDAAVLDVLSGGRVELGIGSANPHPDQFAAFARDPAQRRALYAANAARLRQALGGEQLAPGLRLQPDGSELLDRIWETPATPERVRAAAEGGNGLMLGIGPANTVQADLADAYLDAYAGERPRLAVVHAAFFGPDRATVAEELWPGVRDNSLDFYRASGWVAPDGGAPELLAAMNIHHGTPDDVAASLAGVTVLERASDLILAVQAHHTSLDRAIAALETIATDVAPRLGWTPSQTGAAS